MGKCLARKAELKVTQLIDLVEITDPEMNDDVTYEGRHHSIDEPRHPG